MEAPWRARRPSWCQRKNHVHSISSRHDCLPGLGELLVVEDNEVVVLAVEGVDVVRRVARRTDLLHAGALVLPGINDAIAALLIVERGDDDVIGIRIHQSADRRPVRPRDALARIVRNATSVTQIAGHVAAGARRRRGIVASEHPLSGVEVHLIPEIAIGHAVLGLLVDFLLRVVRPEVTLSAVLGLAGATRREIVATVAGRARTTRSVEIEAPNSCVRPRSRVVQRAPIFVSRDALDDREICG